MSGTFRPEPEASAELEDAALWYEGQRLGLGLEFVQAVDFALDEITAWPQIGRRVTGLPNDVAVRHVPVKRFPYHAVYLPWEGAFRILAFAHDSREPGYWLSRIRK
jgi:plasmid stabilization system protein ParE